MIYLEKPHQRLRAVRMARNYSDAKDFADSHPDIKYKTYVKHESGIIPLSLKAAEKYAEYLDVSTDFLINGNDATEGETHNRSLRRNAMEPIILGKLLAVSLKLIDHDSRDMLFTSTAFQEKIDYGVLIKSLYMSANEIADRVSDPSEMDEVINTIASLNRKSFFGCLKK